MQNANANDGSGVKSEISGKILGSAVQARDVSGGIHMYRADVAPALVPRQLPAAIRDFTGRAADLAALDALIPGEKYESAVQRLNAVVITAIDGSAGIGKTALAIYWAHRVRDRFPDGTLYANLRGYGPGEPATSGEVLEGFLRALGAAVGQIPLGIDEQSATFRSLLDGRRILIMLDNASLPQQIRPLLPAGGGCLVVITSRSSLAGLVISHSAVRISLDLLPLDDAVELLRSIVGPARADADPMALMEIAYACARLPLALRIAGQRVASRTRVSLADVQAEFAQERDRVEVLSASGDESTMVRAVFNWSYNVLQRDSAVVFRYLGLQPGTEITAHAAAALADVSISRARSILETLAEAHLIESVARSRYQIHDLLRVYALERAEDEDPPIKRRRALIRLLEFYLYTADAADRRLIVRNRFSGSPLKAPRHALAFETEEQVADWFRTERATLVAAIHCAAESELYALAWQLSEIIHALFDRDGNRHDWLDTLRRGLQCARRIGDRRAESLMLTRLGDVLTQVGEYAEAIELHSQAVDLADTVADPIWHAEMLDYLGMAYHGAHLYDQAIQCFTESLHMYRSLNDSQWHEAITLNNLGHVYTDTNRPLEAEKLHAQALVVFGTAQDRSREGWSLRLLADAYQAQGNWNEAIICYNRALDVLDPVGYTQEQARASVGLGNCLHQVGDEVRARTEWERANTLFSGIGDPQADEVAARLNRCPMNSTDG